jgi:general secretion pathway protein C
MSVPYAPARWPVAVTTTGLWALAAASIVFWGLRLAAPSDAVAPPAVTKAQPDPDPAAVAQMLGAVSAHAAAVAAPEAASRFSLLGVVADADKRGAALIAVDGKPPRPFKVGATVADGFVLQSVSTRAASLGAGVNASPALTLQLPTRPLAVMTPPTPPVSAPAPLTPPTGPRR